MGTDINTLLLFRGSMRTEELEIALRVLQDICRHMEPEKCDVEALERMAETEQERLMTPNDLACAVIIRERKQILEKMLCARY